MTLLSLATLMVLVVAAGSFFVDEPIRREIEQQMNQTLKGTGRRGPRL